MPRMRSIVFMLVAVLVLAISSSASAASGTAPGAPGDNAIWTPADKHGFGTSTTTTSKVWHTLENGKLTEVYYPDLGTPSVRDLQFIVSDGKTFAELESDATTHQTTLVDNRSLTYRQVNTAKSGRYRITKTYVTDPARNTLLIDVRFQSLTGRPYQVYAYVDPSLSNDGSDDSGTTSHGALLTQDASAGSALVAEPSFGRTSTGYLDASDGWIDLPDDHRMDWHYRSSPNGNVVQTAQTARRAPPPAPAPRPGPRRPPPPAPAARAGLRRHERRGARHRARVAAARFRPRRRGVRRHMAPLPGLAQAPAGQHEAVRRRVRRVGHGPRRPRGQDLPRRLHRLADHAVGVGDGVRVPQVGRLPRGVVARPLPDRHRDDGGRRPRRRRAPAGLRLRQAAAPRRLHPAEHLRRRIAALGRHSAGRGRLPDRPGVAAAPRRRTDLRPARQAGGRLARPDGAPE